MANQKQDGSNITSVEYYTGRCPTMCEQCFVNFGQQGCTTVKNVTHPKCKSWFEYAKQESRRPCLRGKRPYTWQAPDPDPTGERLGKIGAKGSIAVPMRDNPIVRWPAQKHFITLHGKEYPLFLRVSSMSDSSYSPDYWLMGIHDHWGDKCFFNSAIRAIKSKPQNMDLYHKLVVTLNPGAQTPSKIKPTIAEGGGVPNSEVKGSIKRCDEDFFHPTSLGMIGLGQYEDIIKFYRLRAIPTIRGEVPSSVRSPVVVTQMRFKSLPYACEFARHYGVNIRAEVATTEAIKDCEYFKIDYQEMPQGSGMRVFLSDSRKENASEYRGKESEYVFANGFLRPVDTDYFSGDPWVCDRAHGGCEDCGLCASLDGTEVGDANPLNTFDPIPGPDGAVYIGVQKAEDSDFFGGILEQAGASGDVSNIYEYYVEPRLRRNPDVMPLQDVEKVFQYVVDYMLQGLDGESFCEGWNTHEKAATATALGVWSLMRHARYVTNSDEEAFDWIFDQIWQMTNGIEVLDGVEDLWAMWYDESIWTSQFGSTL